MLIYSRNDYYCSTFQTLLDIHSVFLPTSLVCSQSWHQLVLFLTAVEKGSFVFITN